MRSPRRLAPALGTALLAVAALAPSPASAASCTFDAAAAKVTVGYGAPGELARVGRSSAGAIQLDGAACGAATVTNTDLIQATGGQGVQRLVIDLAGGPLAPGKTAETGQASEIEIAVDAGTGGEFPLSDEVRVIGAAGADQLGFAGGGLLLNGDGDTDVTTTGAEALAAEGGGGNDRLLGAGATLPLVLDGGAGDDVLEGGDRDDTLEGGPGNDTETGNEGTDRFRQGSVADGRDTLDGGGSPYDEIDYSARTTAVRIDLDGVADDGAAGELDNLRDSFEYLTGGGGSDTIVASPTRYQPFEVHGNGGDDVLTGGANTDQLFGGDGQDTLDGLASTDSLAGGPGDDTEIGGDGSDVFLQADEPDGADDLQGGAGTDHYTARGRTADLTVKLDGVAGDGATGEGDNVRADVEHVTTGRGDDTVTGSAADNTFDGGPGGDDKLSGGDGKDLVSGWSENDTLDGGAGDDEVRGGDGSDRVSGGTGADGVFGDEGEDLLLEPPARDGADRLTGGGGRDRASYAFRGAGVTVTLDDLANDGAAGEGDDVRAETVTGSAAADRLTGSPAIDVLDGGRGDDRLEGLGDDDTLSGGTGADALVGGDGRDLADYRAHTAAITVTLAGGADDGAAGEGDDAQTEDVAGGSGSDRITGTSGANHLDGGRGNDILDGGLGADYLIGSTGTDTASYATRSTRVVLSIGEALDGMDRDGDGKAEEGDFVDTTVESLTGGAGADRLTGGSGAGVLSGNGGDDVLDGLYGADQLIGGTGRDTADYATRSEPVSVTLDAAADDGAEGERDRVSTTVEVVVGGHAGDRLTGGAGNELLRGARGDDVLAGGAGADDLFGGYGTDTVTYAERPAAEPVVVTLDNLANDGAFETERDNVRTDVESLVGGAGDDDLRADDGPNTLSGGPAGADRLYARGGDDRLDEGPNPPDSSADRDELFGGDGRDTADYSHRTEGLRLSLDGIPNDGVPAATGRGAESDNIHADVEDVVGGTGTDVITGDARANRLEGRGSNDRLEGGDGPDALYGGDSPDRLYGDKGDDHLHGEKSNNALYGGDGDDTLVESSSRAGNDLFEGGPGRDAVDYGRRQASLILDNDGEPGDDGLDADRDFDAEEADTIAEDIEIMRGGFAADRLTSRPYLDEGCTVLDGSGGADVLTGNASDDLLLGGHGDDQLWGEAGDDVLHGGPDNDEELGDSGADVFWQGGFGGGCGAPARAATEGPDGQDEIVAGSNDDTIHYHRSAGDIELTLNDQTPNDGAWNERDRVRDMENAHGGAGNDHIVGTSEDNELSGGPAGSDRLEGRGAGDRLISAFDPDGGGDTLLGEGGSDKFLTADGDGRDTLDGGLDRDYGEWDAGDAREDTP